MRVAPSAAGDAGEQLRQYQERDLLRFLTCGSVDDGKSTLIGRLLHDSGGISDDQMDSLRRESARRGMTDGIDLSLIVDGLEAEREQGITIDVAYRYFATARRKFIIADTPGHEQYTRNMATGASTSDLAVILVDPRAGVLEQTRRHAFIASLFEIRHLVVAINKMDLVDYSQDAYENVRRSFSDFATHLQVTDVEFIPVSALRGDNVVHSTNRMPWYRGGPLLDLLETVRVCSDRNLTDFRYPVQSVVRVDPAFRGYCGTIGSGVVRRGDDILVMPAATRSRVRSIATYDGELEEAFAPMSVMLTLDDDVDVGRGDMLVHPDNVPKVGRVFEATLVWMSEQPLEIEREYLLKHTTVLTPATITRIFHRIDVSTLCREDHGPVAMNAIGRVQVETSRALAYDEYAANRENGAFILIDRMTNATIACGMIVAGEDARADAGRQLVRSSDEPAAGAFRLTPNAAVIVLHGRSGAPPDRIARALKDRILSAGRAACTVEERTLRLALNSDLGFNSEDLVEQARRISAVARLFAEAGLIPIVVAGSSEIKATMLRTLEGRSRLLLVYFDEPAASRASSTSDAHTPAGPGGDAIEVCVSGSDIEDAVEAILARLGNL